MGVLIQIEDITKHYGAQVVLDGATASFSEGQKIGIIGRNGAGKSTLCRILCGQEEADRGEVHKNRELRLSHLEQHDQFLKGETVLDFLMRFSEKEAWQCGEVGARFHLHHKTLDAAVDSLPGGYRTRVKLAAMLLRDPNFLILDEPTNFLDLSTLILLENFLQSFRGGYLIVSHDREFLKRTCDHTLEIERGELTLYPGGVEDYFEFKEEQLAQKQAYNRTVEKKRAQLQDFVDRFKAKASTASRAKSKMKQMNKLETIEIAHTLDTVRIAIPPVEYKTGIALSISDLAIGYPERTIATDIQLEIDRGEKVAILGDNGQGKTTFLRTLAGDLTPKTGSLKWGTGLKVAYYAQHVFASLHPEDSVFSHLQSVAADGITNQEILDMAGAFLFKGDETKKKVAVLSGGERARLLLAGLLLTRSQVLLLDEPTNHLDFETVEALAKSLKKYSGTIFLVSHDRTFVNLIATYILEINQGKIRKYPGVYEDYVYRLEKDAQNLGGSADNEEAQEMPSKRRGSSSSEGAASNSVEAAEAEKKQRKEAEAEIKKMQVKASKIESRLQHLTREKESLVQEMNLNPFHFSRDRNEQLRQIQISLENTESEWLEILEKIEKLKKKATQA